MVYVDGFFQFGESLVEIFKLCLCIADFGNIWREELSKSMDNPLIVLKNALVR
jgi:hypothetical protein